MKLYPALGIIAAVVVSIGSYSVGFHRGKEEMDVFSGNLVGGISAGIRGESLPLLLSAAEALKYPEQQDIQKALRRYARSQATVVKECSASKACAALTAQPLPQAALVDLALSYK
jgi:hypothetical protein